MGEKPRPATLKAPDGKRKVLAPIRPSLALEQQYQARLEALVDQLNRSITYWTKAAYRQNEPATLAMDRSPADILNSIMNRLARRWLSRFAKLAPDLAKWLATSAQQRTDASLRAALKKGGLTVAFRPTPAVKDVIASSVEANVALIKSIPEQYLLQVRGIVMRGVQNGRDVGLIAKELQEQLGVTKRRAAFIALDQSNKATAAITKTRQLEIGITEAVWLHSAGGKTPRPSHVKAGRDKLVYKVAEGALIDGERIWPGQLINCRCVGRSILPKA